MYCKIIKVLIQLSIHWQFNICFIEIILLSVKSQNCLKDVFVINQKSYSLWQTCHNLSKIIVLEYQIWTEKKTRESKLRGRHISLDNVKCIKEKRKEWLWNICRDAWEKHNIPKNWDNNLLLPTYKKGGCSNPIR